MASNERNSISMLCGFYKDLVFIRPLQGTPPPRSTPHRYHRLYPPYSVIMPQHTVFVTGLNGYIASVLAKYLLDNGYNVRGSVRRHASADPLVSGPLKSYAESGALSVIEVPDITVDGAFDEAVKGVTAIAHLATPVSMGFTDPEPIINTAVNGTRSILYSALKAGPQLKSFVVLSSVVAIMSSAQPPYVFTESDWNDWAEPTVAAKGKDAPGMAIYCASKVAAEKAFWAFKDQEKPSFTQTALNPVFVIGPPLVAPKTVDQIGETVRSTWDIFSGSEFPGPGIVPGLGAVVDVRDVAAQTEYIIAHPEETDGERYLSSAAHSTAQSVADVLRKTFPDAKRRIVEGTPGEGYSPDYQVFDKQTTPVFDGSKAKKLLEGNEYIPYEQSIVDTAKAFVHLL